VSPTHYITGAEQAEHFASLGLKDRHLAMGLVLGKDNKKMKSRTGDAFSAEDAVEAIMGCLDDTPARKKLAWNVLCWNFLHASKSQTIRFDEEKWTEDDAPGLYITYTYARFLKALGGDLNQKCCEITDNDLKLLGISEYKNYWLERCIANMDTAPLANYAHELARAMSNAYHGERIVGGRQTWRFVVAMPPKHCGRQWNFLGCSRLRKFNVKRMVVASEVHGQEVHAEEHQVEARQLDPAPHLREGVPEEAGFESQDSSGVDSPSSWYFGRADHEDDR
jgi:hypothetical protein